MSSFICSSKHFDSIEKTLLYKIIDCNWSARYSLRTIAPKWYNNRNHTIAETTKEITEFINVLREFNVFSVCQQYKDSKEEYEVQLEIVNVKGEGELLKDVALYKAIQCLLYQIEANPLTDEQKNAITFITEVKNELSDDIINNLKEYEVAQWEIN